MSSVSEILFFVAGGMFKRSFPVESLNPQSAGKEIYISKSAEHT